MAAAIRALGDPSEAGPAADPHSLAPLYSTPVGGWREARPGGGNGRPRAVWGAPTSSPAALTCFFSPETSLGRRLTPPVGAEGTGCVRGHVPRSLHKAPPGVLGLRGATPHRTGTSEPRLHGQLHLPRLGPWTIVLADHKKPPPRVQGPTREHSHLGDTEDRQEQHTPQGRVNLSPNVQSHPAEEEGRSAAEGLHLL